MKEINQIIHLTNSKDTLKSILKNGLYTSYAKESFGNKNILIPMISFANIQFRDIGNKEVVDYGKYGIVFDRELAIDKFDLNPVFYVKSNSVLDLSFKYNFENSILPQALPDIKKVYDDTICERFTDHVTFNPITEEMKNLLNTLDKNVNNDFLESLKGIFENYFINSMKQVLLLKPFKVTNKEGTNKIAFNEREWRKSFFDLHFISEYKPNDELNDEYTRWINKQKPHFTEKNILNFELSDIKYIYVENTSEIKELHEFISDNFGVNTIEINTLTEFKIKESVS